MKQLSVYLNDHLAGSVAAIELLDDLIKIYEGQPLAKFFADLRNDVSADQEALRKLLKKFKTGKARFGKRARG